MSGDQNPNAVRTEREFYSGPELAAHAGITYRRLDYWTRAGHLWPVHLEPKPVTGTGRRLTFPRREVGVATWMGELVDHGMTPTLAAAVARQLVDTGSAKLGDQLRITLTRGEDQG